MTFSNAALALFATADAAASAAALTGGTIEFLAGGGEVLVSASLGAPTASGAVTTMGGFPRTVTATAGTIASARYRTSGALDWKSDMTVGLAGSGAQVIVASLTIAAGQQVTISSATLTHAAA